jgi:hypothetical protein
MKIIYLIFFSLVCLSFKNGYLFAQVLNLDSLYISKPSDSERDNIIKTFNITLKDGDESYAKWSLYDPYYFNPNSTNPSVYSLVNSLRVIRDQKFSEPLPFTENMYQYLLSHYQYGGIELSLRKGYNYGGGNWTYLNANAAFWDGRGSDPFTPYPTFSVYPYTYKVQLLLHETRHSDSDDPGHDPNVAGYDTRFSTEGAYARDAIYNMWIYKYGINNNKLFKSASAAEAVNILMNRFVEMPPTHPNQKVQKLIDELMPKIKIKDGNNQVGEIGSVLPNFLQVSVYNTINEYEWQLPVGIVFNVVSAPKDSKGYSLSSNITQTCNGFPGEPASVSFKIGDKPGTYIISAKAPTLGKDSVVFSIYTLTTDINLIINSQNINVYPNPTSGRVRILFDQFPPSESYMIITNTSEKIIVKKLIQNNEELIDLTGNPPGIYILRTNIRYLRVQKIVLE